MGAGTIFEESEQQKKDSNFFYFATQLSNLPTLDIVFWVGKRTSLPTRSLNVKRELSIYHNTVLFCTSPGWAVVTQTLFKKGNSGWAHDHPAHPVPAPMG